MTVYIDWFIDLIHESYTFLTADSLFSLCMSAIFCLFFVCLIKNLIVGRFF